MATLDTTPYLSRPSLAGNMAVSSQYNVLNQSYTDRVFLLGHADGLPLLDPYPVINVQDAVNLMNADSMSPLMKGMLELYYGGAKDIWLMSVAPMSEYKDVPGRDAGWHATYASRLQAAYNVLDDWDFPHIVVPLNAPFVDGMGTDFLTPLAHSCLSSFNRTGLVRFGLIGTQTGASTHSLVEAMVNDSRLQDLGDAGKFICVVVGEGMINIKELPTAYNTSLVTSVAAVLCSLPWNASLTHKSLPLVSAWTTPIPDADLDALALARLNPIGNTSLGDRGMPFNAVILTDNTLGQLGTDYWSMTQIRFIQHLIEALRALGRRYMGTIGYGQFKTDVQSYLIHLMTSNTIRDYTLDIVRNPQDQSQVFVNVSIKMYYGLRNITFTTAVGPSN